MREDSDELDYIVSLRGCMMALFIAIHSLPGKRCITATSTSGHGRKQSTQSLNNETVKHVRKYQLGRSCQNLPFLSEYTSQ